MVPVPGEASPRGRFPGPAGQPLLFQKEEGSALGSSEATVSSCLWPEAPPSDLASRRQASWGVKMVPKEPRGGHLPSVMGAQCPLCHLPGPVWSGTGS